MKIAIISTYLPQQCGIATYTHDLFRVIKSIDNKVDIIAIQNDTNFNYPTEVRETISKDIAEEYSRIAAYLNAHYDICILQHEYGIFGGLSGSYILEVTDHLSIPLITNFHTILKTPSPQEEKILRRIAQSSVLIIVMTNHAVQLLDTLYHIPLEKIKMIPHGVPSFDYNQKKAKSSICMEQDIILLSFGFLGRNKGYETAIEAVHKVNNPILKYIILGTTHPNVLISEGEEYRGFLQNKIESLGLSNQIKIIDGFVSDVDLMKYLSACDMYVTPYPNENQISSGTLSFAIGAGAAVISTPYLYAKDLLANDRGLFFGFNNPEELAQILRSLIDNPKKLQYYRGNAQKYGKNMHWPAVGEKYKHVLKLIHEKV